MTNRICLNNFLPWLAAAAGGVLAFLGYAGFDQFYLGWICLVPVLWAIRHQSPARAFFLGWVAGIVGHGGGFYWIITVRALRGLSWRPPRPDSVLLAAANGVVFAVGGLTRLSRGKTGWSVLVAPDHLAARENSGRIFRPGSIAALTQIADVTGISAYLPGVYATPSSTQSSTAVEPAAF